MSIEFYEDHVLDTETGRRYALSCPWEPPAADGLDIPGFLRREQKEEPARVVVTAPVKEPNPEEVRQQVREWKWQNRNRRR